MRYWSIFVFVLMPSLVSASDYLAARPVDGIAAEALERVVARSATARALLERLDASNVIVHIESSRTMPSGIGGMTRFVVSRGGVRYLRITIGTNLPGRLRAAILAHELQHACEVADSAADDAVNLRVLFEQQGHRNGEFFETTAAIEAERHVQLELRTARRTLQAEPVVKFHH
jgi:hypothetical protein